MIKSLATQCGIGWDDKYHWYVGADSLVKFVDAIKQSIYDQVKEELIPDDIIAEETPQLQEYLKGCNGGTVDALVHIKNFGLDLDET
jgi:hypothetical protein